MGEAYFQESHPAEKKRIVSRPKMFWRVHCVHFGRHQFPLAGLSFFETISQGRDHSRNSPPKQSFLASSENFLLPIIQNYYFFQRRKRAAKHGQGWVTNLISGSFEDGQWAAKQLFMQMGLGRRGGCRLISRARRVETERVSEWVQLCFFVSAAQRCFCASLSWSPSRNINAAQNGSRAGWLAFRNSWCAHLSRDKTSFTQRQPGIGNKSVQICSFLTRPSFAPVKINAQLLDASVKRH
jgi:hypothetical protein